MPATRDPTAGCVGLGGFLPPNNFDGSLMSQSICFTTTHPGIRLVSWAIDN